jgi:hypothetical protein
MKELATKLNQVNPAVEPVVGIVYLLLTYFKEDDTTLFRGFEVKVNVKFLSIQNSVYS